MKIDFEKALNSEQLAAVRAPDKPAFVLAAAGTGKTRTLVYRVAYLAEKNVDAQRILLLTFTNKAAAEMLQRADALVESSVGGLWGGTFHHMANRILRRNAHRLGYGLDFSIMDRDDSKSLMRECVNDLKLKSKEMPKPDVLVSILSAAVNSCVPVDRVVEDRFANHPIEPADIIRIFNRYIARKRQINAMDFDDLLVNGLELFRQFREIREKYSEQFLYVLVDEYQDTNPIQSEWVDLIAARHRNVMVVGDDFQSIYSWRGADYRNIMTFSERYPDALSFKLETNYRSVPEILNVANICIAGNPYQFQKTLRATREKLEPPILATMRDGEEQAAYVIEELVKCHRKGVKWKDIAVIYRAHFHAMELQLAFTRANIPFVVTSGMRFFEQAHIKDVASLLRILTMPADELAFNRLMQLLPGMGPRTTAKIWRKIGGKFERTPETRSLLAESLPSAAAEIWKQIDVVIDMYDNEGLKDDPGEVIYQFLKNFYDNYMINTFDNYKRRVDDIQEFISFSTSFEDTETFLSEMSLATNMDAESDLSENYTGDSIRLSTIHQAKGLEWDVVFIPWVSEGMFPSNRALQESGEDSEERRLFYVAVTRAKDRLYLCSPQVRRMPDKSVNFLEPSRFLTEIPPEMLQHKKAGFI